MDGYGAFAALLYVTDTEEDAVKRMYNWETVRFPGDTQVYYRADTVKNGMEIYAARAIYTPV